MEVNGYVNCLVTNSLQSIFFCIQQLNEIHTGLEQIEGEKLQNYICGVNYPFIIADLKVYSKSLFLIIFENKLEMSDDVTNEIFQYTQFYLHKCFPDLYSHHSIIPGYNLFC